MARHPQEVQTPAFVTAVLVADGLRKRFKKVQAVDGVSLSIDPGDRVALLGPNGAGKTTTLLMLLGAITPDEGTVELVGHRLPHGRSTAMRDVGFAAGYLPLPERLRVIEVLQLFGHLHGRPDPETDARRGLERFGVSHLADQMAKELSSGQRTLVAIVKAIQHQPRLLVLDEPTASLDPDVAHRVRSALESVVADDGTTLFVTSHDMREVQRLCRRVIFVSGGRIVADGTPEDVAAEHGDDDLEGVFLRLAAQSRGEMW